MKDYTIQDLQKDIDGFIQSAFPYLRVELYYLGDSVDTQAKLNIWRKNNDPIVWISKQLKEIKSVEHFSQMMENEFSLKVIVRRKMKNAWLPVNHTLHLNFSQQNKIGLELALSENDI